MIRLIFAGFAAVMAGVVINTLLLQPQVAAPLAAKPAPAPPAATAPVTTAVTLPSAKPLLRAANVSAPQAIAVVQTKSSEAKPAPAAVSDGAKEPPREPVRQARLATDSVQQARLPRLPEPEGDPELILRVQKELMARGYGPVVPNGIAGPLSRAAVMAYEYDNVLPLTGEATEPLLKRMREGAPAARTPHAEARKIRTPEAEQVVRTVQHSLATLGYDAGRIDGRVGEETERAIRAFEAASGLPETGRVSAELFSKLARAMGARSAKIAP